MQGPSIHYLFNIIGVRIIPISILLEAKSSANFRPLATFVYPPTEAILSLTAIYYKE
jgi:hypothetical protein